MTVALLTVLWLTLAAVPFGWWWRHRARTDGWRSLPLPAAVLDANGDVVERTGPPSATSFANAGPPPATGELVRLRSGDGEELVVIGVARGAVAVAVPMTRDPRAAALAGEVARLAHDINSPISALLGHLDLIAHQPISDVVADSVATCRQELERLNATARDLLLVNRLRAGAGPRRTALAGALVEQAAHAFHDVAYGRGATLAVDVPHTRVAVSVAEADLVRALENLLANAFNYGLTGGDDLRIGAALDERGQVRFTVADRGPGLTTARLAELSEPLVRGTEHATDGHGLGLAIVTEVLRGHDAALETWPRDGGGAIVGFTLRPVP